MTVISALLLATVTTLTSPTPLPQAPAPGAAPAPAGHLERALVAATTAEGATRHLAALQRIADGAGGSRAAGTPGHERSARYAGRLLEAAGYDVTYQRFDFDHREPVAERLTQLTPRERALPIRLMTYTASTPEGGVEAPLADAGDGCESGDFPEGAFRGRIALIERGECTFARKAANAAAAGAVGAVVRNNVPGALSGTLDADSPAGIPVGGIGQEDGAELHQALADGSEVRVRLELRERSERRTTTNVLADSPGGDPSRTVLVGAHLDSVPEGPGINDNGSGAAGVLETALRLAAVDPAGRHGNRVRFALWSAEEEGLLGSKHYVAGLSAAERSDVALYLNFDMIGSPNHGIFVYAADPDADPARSAAVSEDLTAFLRARGDSPAPARFDGRSDYAPFLAAGIPAGGAYTGAEGIKTEAQAEAWGGTPGAPFDPCYHAACDDHGNIGAEALEAGVKLIAHAVGSYAERLPAAH
ncbi:M28 family peptidase [Streptomyces hoynatensis]|uniref:M28 family peptidase n=1 Tax=Streptomyces hoynatensis TaxID=1141874 RepID=UPI00240CEB51|nr:M28 family peptidase [Streptomyces hoynatensis]